MVNSLKFKNRSLKWLASFLKVQLHGSQSRARTRFLRIVNPLGEEFNETRLEKLKELTPKDDKGEPKMIPGTNTYDLGEKQKEFAEWFALFLEEEAVIDILPSNKDDIAEVRNILLNLDQELNDEGAEELEQILEAFEVAAKAEAPVKKAKKK
jgi:hypothetical protein